jgi:AraC family transcriptional regulator
MPRRQESGRTRVNGRLKEPAMRYDSLAPGRFYGEQQSARQVGGLTLTEYRYAPEQVIPRHAHRLAYFCVVLQGSYHEQSGGRSRDCSGAMLIFHPEGEIHSDEFNRAGGHLFSIETDAAWLQRIREYGSVLDRPGEMAGGPAQALGIQLFREFISLEAASAPAIEGLTLEVLSLALRTAARAERWHPAWLRTAEEYLRAHFHQEVGLEALAAEVGAHPSHFARIFRAHYRCTAGEFVRRLRVEQACQRLGERETEIAALAAELGFADQSHFTRTFKRHTGYTPVELRRAYHSR